MLPPWLLLLNFEIWNFEIWNLKFEIWNLKFVISKLTCCSICSVDTWSVRIGSQEGNTDSRIIFRKPGETEITTYSQTLISWVNFYLTSGPGDEVHKSRHDRFLMIFQFDLSQNWHEVCSYTNSVCRRKLSKFISKKFKIL